MTKVLAIAFNGTRETGQFPGDQMCSIKAAYLFAENYPADKILLALSPHNEMNFLWQKFIDTYKVDIVYDTFHVGNMEQRFEAWQLWQQTREIEGRKFDAYRELYRRIDGGRRQPQLCGSERGLGRKNIFEYFYFGQEDPINQPIKGIDTFDDTLIYHEAKPRTHDVMIAPHAKCQGNSVFTMEYWSNVVHQLIDAGLTVTVNYNGHFCDELDGHQLYRKIFPDIPGFIDEVCRHRLMACGNTGVGWLAAACGIPLLAMQPPYSNMPDYRYELCGVKSLIEIIAEPDADYCAKRIVEEVGNKMIVFTTGCYDVLHAGHINHLRESKTLGSRLVVGLNSDVSIRNIKGENRPINTQDQRAAILRELRCVDEVRVFDGDNALDLIRELRPAVITNGCDHKVDEVVGREFVESYGGRVVITSGTRTQSSTRIIHAVKHADVMNAIRDGARVSLNPLPKLKLMADELLSVVNLDGDIADVGAYRGGTSLILRRLAPHKHLHLFDTWAGLPVDDPLCHHKKGEWQAALDDCKRLVGVDERTHYHQDDIRKCVDGFSAPLCFAYVDVDTYQGTVDAINMCWPHMVSGGKMFFDDHLWHCCQGVQKAIEEAFDESQRVVYPDRFTCVITKP